MKNNSKGFTLVEMVMSLAISLIVIAIVASMLAITKNNMVVTTNSASKVNEYYNVEKFVNNWLAVFSTSDYEIITPDRLEPEENDGKTAQRKVTFVLRDDVHTLLYYSMIYDPATKELSCQYPSGIQQLSIPVATDLIFSRQENMIKATLVYEKVDKDIRTETTYTMLFNYYF